MIRLHAEQHPCISEINRDLPQGYARQLMEIYAYKIAAQAVTNKAVLDLGCNDGYGTKILSETSARVIGVDVSEKAIHKAITQNSSNNVEFHVTDGTHLPFEEKQFDVVVSFQVIEHIEGSHKYLSEIRRTLKATGVAMFTTPNAVIRLDPGMKPWNPFHVREYNHSELSSQLKSYFSYVGIKGLFAKGELYPFFINSMKEARDNARKQQRIQQRPLFWRQIKKTIPLFIFSSWNNLQRSLKKPFLKELGSRTIDTNLKEIFSLDQLEYRTDNLDASMDLMAVCTDDKEIFERWFD